MPDSDAPEHRHPEVVEVIVQHVEQGPPTILVVLEPGDEAERQSRKTVERAERLGGWRV